MGTRLRSCLAAAVIAGGVAAVRATRPPDPDALFQQARADLASAHPERARSTLSRLERLRPPAPFDRLLRAQVDEALGRPDDAVRELASIDGRHPLAPLARTRAGKIELERGRLRAAEAELLAAIDLKPDSVLPRRDLVYIYNLQLRQADLDATLHALSELEPLDFQYLLHWGKARNVVWNPTRDAEALSRAVAADPEDRRSRLALAEGLRSQSRLDEAEAALAPLPDSDPDARAARALLRMDRGDPDGANALLAAGGDHPALARLRGQVAMSKGDAASAVRHLRIAQAADPLDRSVNYALGSALRASGHADEAEPYLESARRHDALNPLISRASTPEGARDPALPALLGAACERAGRLLEARAWYKLVINRDPLDREAQAAFHRLGSEIAAREVAP